MKKVKVGIVLMLIGIGIPLVLFFFQREGYLFNIKYEKKENLTERERHAIMSIYNLSKSISGIESSLSTITDEYGKLDLLTTEQLGLFDKEKDLEAKIEGLNEEIETILKDVADPEDLATLKSGEALIDLSWLGEKPVFQSISIPYSNFVGIAIALFITGMGIVIISLIGNKGRKP